MGSYQKPASNAVKHVGEGLPPIAECQSLHLVTDPTLSGASPLPHLHRVCTLALWCVCYTTNDSNMMKISATTDRMVSIAVQVLNVSATVMLKYCFTSQNPASLTCDKINDPAPVANTSSSRLTPGIIPTTGTTMPAPVMVATVAEPVAIRITAATSHASRIGLICAFTAIWPITSPTPLVTSICLKPPPAPMIRMIAAVGARLASSSLSTRLESMPWRLPKVYSANSRASSKALIG